MSETKQDTLDYHARKIMEWLNENHHPHVEVAITPAHYELKEGLRSSGKILDYVRD